MTQHLPKISVIMITYNQEDVIDRTLSSLLSQSCLYQICVSDDCSKDRTWEILQDYSKNYPGVFKLHRNDPNLGIFANEEQTWTMPDGDIIYRIAGDDECCEGYFQKVVDFILSNGIDWENELFCIVGDNVTIYPDGKRKLTKNQILSQGYPALKLKLRGLLNDRSACFSGKVLQKYVPVSKGRSFVVEEAQDDQLEIFSEKFYYLGVPGNVYHSEQGVSSRLTLEEMKDREGLYLYFEKFLGTIGIELDKHDRSYVRYRTAMLCFLYERDAKALLSAVKYYLKSLDFSLGVHTVNLAHLKIALERRLVKVIRKIRDVFKCR